jgi:predicted carbohydrate-binding protein with CBM5 and CBM33 domain
MQNTVSKVMASASMIALVSAHGFILSPAPRMPGSAMSDTCGQQMYNNQMGDNYGNVQGQLQVTNGQTDYDAAACDIWLCKGYKYDDNTENVQEYTVGQEVDISVDIRAPHTGVANVSVVSTSSGAVLGSALKSWDEYGSNAYTIPEDQKEFSITIPDEASECSSPGDCVIQWFWDAADIDQTYESCIDFVVGGGSGSGSSSGSGSGSSSGGASNGTSSSAPSSSASSSAVASSTAASSTVASPSSAAESTTAPVTPTKDEEADSTCEVVYVTASAAAEKPARRHRRHARRNNRRHN